MADEDFRWPVRVYYEDTDAQGVVYYANYFRFMERARTEWLRALGIDQPDLLYDQRCMFVVTSTTLDFLTPAKFNDELAVTVSLTSLRRASFDMEQRIYRINADADETLCCEGSVRAACVNADTLKPVRVPAGFFEV